MVKTPVALAVLAFGAFGALAAAQPAQAQAERSGEEIVKRQCANCHQTGVHGAPKIDDRAAWAPRMKNGLAATVRSAINGHGAMPARGGLANVTDTELRAAILYMFYPAGAGVKAPAERAAARDPNHRNLDGMEIYLGIVPAETAAVKQPRPSGRGYFYVNVSVRDSTTLADIRDAQVEARAANPVTGGETRKLDLMTVNGAASYGNFFRMSGREPYTITVHIRRPGSAQTSEARFDFRP